MCKVYKKYQFFMLECPMAEISSRKYQKLLKDSKNARSGTRRAWIPICFDHFTSDLGSLKNKHFVFSFELNLSNF